MSEEWSSIIKTEGQKMIPMDDLIPQFTWNVHPMSFQTLHAMTDIYKFSFLPIRRKKKSCVYCNPTDPL